MKRIDAQPGFTLIELLVTISIIALLIALLLPVLGSARDSARGTATLAAMQQTMLAYHSRAVDYKDELLPGYLPQGKYKGKTPEARLPTGVVVRGFIARRYPLRLAEYQGDAWRMIYQHVEPPELPGIDDANKTTKAYQLSLGPSFGLNSAYVGGDADVGNAFRAAPNSIGNFLPNPAGPAVFQLSKVRRPTQLIAFAETQKYDGIRPPDGTGSFRVDPPRTFGHIWTAKQNSIQLAMPGGTEDVPLPRYNDAPAMGMLDGHCETLGPDALNDMRNWSNRADHAAYQINAR